MSAAMDKISYADLYARWERGNWQATAIDLSADRQQWLMDGVNASNIGLEIPQALFNPPVEAVQEIKVHQNAYSA